MRSDEHFDEPTQDVNLTVWFVPDAGEIVHVESVCDQLLTEFPGSVITAQNSFVAKRSSIEMFRQNSQERLRQGTLEPWSWKSMDELNEGIDQLIEDNRRAELRSGPQKDLAIPLGNGARLVGHVGAKSIIFRGHCQLSDITVANLVRFLKSLGIGRVEILNGAPTPS
jgi:hypothetical protein